MLERRLREGWGDAAVASGGSGGRKRGLKVEPLTVANLAARESLPPAMGFAPSSGLIPSPCVPLPETGSKHTLGHPLPDRSTPPEGMLRKELPNQSSVVVDVLAALTLTPKAQLPPLTCTLSMPTSSLSSHATEPLPSLVPGGPATEGDVGLNSHRVMRRSRSEGGLDDTAQGRHLMDLIGSKGEECSTESVAEEGSAHYPKSGGKGPGSEEERANTSSWTSTPLRDRISWTQTSDEVHVYVMLPKGRERIVPKLGTEK